MTFDATNRTYSLWPIDLTYHMIIFFPSRLKSMKAD